MTKRRETVTYSDPASLIRALTSAAGLNINFVFTPPGEPGVNISEPRFDENAEDFHGPSHIEPEPAQDVGAPVNHQTIRLSGPTAEAKHFIREMAGMTPPELKLLTDAIDLLTYYRVSSQPGWRARRVFKLISALRELDAEDHAQVRKVAKSMNSAWN